MHRPATETTAALRPMVYASLFAALTAVGAYISVPIGPVPIVMQNMFVFLAGLLLGSRWGLASLAVLPAGGGLRAAGFRRRDRGHRTVCRADRRIPRGLFAGGLLGWMDCGASSGEHAPGCGGDGLRGRRALCLRGAVADDGDRHAFVQGARGRHAAVFGRGCPQDRRGSPDRQIRQTVDAVVITMGSRFSGSTVHG